METKITVVEEKDKVKFYGIGYNCIGEMRYGKVGEILYNKKYDVIYFNPAFFAVKFSESAIKIINDEMQKMRRKLK